jgi:Tfp pilus assembly protein PilF
MSLIYDYLKIHGESDAAWDSDAVIPPTLRNDSEKHKRSNSSKLNSKTAPIILGSFIVIGLFMFLVFSLFAPEEDVQIIADSESLPIMQTQPVITPSTPESIIVVPQQEKSTPVPAVSAPEQGIVPSDNVVQQDTDLAAAHSGVKKKIIPQIPELNRSVQKIKFPEEAQGNTKVKQPAKKVVQGTYQATDLQEYLVDNSSRVIRKSRSGDDKFYFSSRPDSAELNNSKKFYQAGLNAQQSGDQRAAEIYYIKTLEQQPLHLEAMVNLSALFVQQQRYAEAEELLADIVKIEPSNSKALVNMGVINLYKYNEPLAEELFLAALDANPIEENALINLAYLAERKMDYGLTERYYRQVLQISPDNVEVLLAYGHLLEKEKRYSEARALYGDCLKFDNVKKNRQLYDKITQRMRLLAGAARER